MNAIQTVHGGRRSLFFVVATAVLCAVTGSTAAYADSSTPVPPTLSVSSPACEQLNVGLTDNNSISAPPVDYTLTIQLGSQVVDQEVQPGMIGGSGVSSNYPHLAAGTYTVSATGSDGSVATPVSQAVDSCSTAPSQVKLKIKASFGKPNYKTGRVPVKLDNRKSNVRVLLVVFDSRHHFYSQYDVVAGKLRTVKAPIKQHGHSTVKVTLTGYRAGQDYHAVNGRVLAKKNFSHA